MESCTMSQLRLVTVTALLCSPCRSTVTLCQCRGCPSPDLPSRWTLCSPGRADSSCCFLAPRMWGKGQGAWGQDQAGRWKQKALVGNSLQVNEMLELPNKKKTQEADKIIQIEGDHNSATEAKATEGRVRDFNKLGCKDESRAFCEGAVSLVCPASLSSVTGAEQGVI